MNVTIPTLDGPQTIWEPEIAALRGEFPLIDVEGELNKYASWLGREDGRIGLASSLPRCISGWLKRAKPAPGMKPRTSIGQDVEDALRRCIERQLVPPDFRPAGQDDHERLGSIKAQATCNWYRRHPDEVSFTVPKGVRLLWEG